MCEASFVSICKQEVIEYLQLNGNNNVMPGQVRVVWLCKVLQNNKALLSVASCPGVYFEVTHNGDQNEMYVDVYHKFENYTVSI